MAAGDAPSGLETRPSVEPNYGTTATDRNVSRMLRRVGSLVKASHGDAPPPAEPLLPNKNTLQSQLSAPQRHFPSLRRRCIFAIKPAALQHLPQTPLRTFGPAHSASLAGRRRRARRPRVVCHRCVTTARYPSPPRQRFIFRASRYPTFRAMVLPRACPPGRARISNCTQGGQTLPVRFIIGQIRPQPAKPAPQRGAGLDLAPP